MINQVFVTGRSKIFLSWLVFYFAGTFCGLYYEYFRDLVKKIWIPCGIVFAAVLIIIWKKEIVWVNASSSVNFSIVSFLNPGFAMITLLSIPVLFRIAMSLSKFSLVNRSCAFISKVPYNAYLAHVMCINIINSLTVSLIPSLPIYYLWLFAAVLCASVIVGFVEWFAVKNIKLIFTKKNKQKIKLTINIHNNVIYLLYLL